MSLVRNIFQGIEIKLYFYEKIIDGLSKIVILSDEETKELQEKPQEGIIVECLTTRFRKLNWGLQNDIISMSNSVDKATTWQYLNWIRFRDLRLKKTLVAWDLKDEEGRIVPLSDMAINMLPPEVCLALIAKYDEKTTLRDEERRDIGEAMITYLRNGGSGSLPNQVREYILAEKTGWTLDYIRSLDINDHNIFMMLAEIDRNMFEADKASAKKSGQLKLF